MKKIVVAVLSFALCSGMMVPVHALSVEGGTLPVVGYRSGSVNAGNFKETAKKTWTEEELQAHADQVLALINQERDNAGAASVERSESISAAALTRAIECASLNSQRVDGKSHTRPDGSRGFTVLGIQENYHYGENVIQGGNAENQMRRFMESEGHKAIILKEAYTEVGIGCAVSEEGNLFTVQIFFNP